MTAEDCYRIVLAGIQDSDPVETPGRFKVKVMHDFGLSTTTFYGDSIQEILDKVWRKLGK